MFLIKKSHPSEKSLALNGIGKYTFIVDVKATKNEIKKSIGKKYGVSVLDVNTCLYYRKKIKRHTRQRVMEGTQPRYKKAIVTLPKGEFLDIYAN